MAAPKRKAFKKKKPSVGKVVSRSPPQPRGGLAMPKKAPKDLAKARSVGDIGHTSFNAFHASHLPLPRQVAPYSVVRSIENFTLSTSGTTQIWCFIPLMQSGSTAAANAKDRATSYCGWRKLDTTQSPSTNGIDWLNMTGIGSHASGAELVPCALTVRVTCPTAVQTASGQFWLGRWNVAAEPRNYTTYDDMRNGFMAFGHPRPLTAAKLAFEGVEVSAVPRDQTDYSQFLPFNPANVAAITSSGTYTNVDSRYCWPGMTPIFLLSDATPVGTTLNIQVAVECRWRFEMDNVAASTHVEHPAISLDKSNKLIAAQKGNGVGKISQAPANYVRHDGTTVAYS